MALTLEQALNKIGTVGYTGVDGLRRLVSETSAIASKVNEWCVGRTLRLLKFPGKHIAYLCSSRFTDGFGRPLVQALALCYCRSGCSFMRLGVKA